MSSGSHGQVAALRARKQSTISVIMDQWFCNLRRRSVETRDKTGFARKKKRTGRPRRVLSQANVDVERECLTEFNSILHLDLKCHPYKLICYVANELDGATTEGQQFPMRYIFIAHEEKNYSYWTNKTLLMLFTS
ncbi:hypothetical protein J6590_062394 [Homalodisca vitripennis]|nr:hypothetical protein J6590_062388 [Homalodisca vitripennis]KAG8252234.1 hypothetical protein J6590_062394 [Homalodisca vitripennis]